jgi:hypothetical protein
MTAHELCRHCRGKMARYDCARPGCDHRLCSYCIVWGGGDSGWCEDCRVLVLERKAGECRVRD